MTASATRTIVDSTGQALALGRELGRGGEGAVYTVPARPELVAKLYHRPPAAAKGAKLAAMAALGTERLLRLTAWPVGTLHHEPGGPVAGLLMPRIEGHQPIHALYSPKSRLAAFPQAGWPFLVHAAANAARAFAAIHEHGHVIGDVNHGNLVVSSRATVKLIDCDSFQIAAGDQLYRCEVGVATHTPPELQGKSFREVTRTPNHDAFGLAVIVFQLLFMGRHPFSGAYSGPGEMPLERSISEFRFAYSEHAATFQMRPPPGTPALTTVSPEVAALFERAFAAEGATAGRPAPQEWATALAALNQSLTQCGQTRAHHYFKILPDCPWCRIERKAGLLLFGLAAYEVKDAQSGFNIDAIWAQIGAVERPESVSLPEFRPSPAPEVAKLGQARGTANRLGKFLLFAGTLLSLKVVPESLETQALVANLAAAFISFTAYGPKYRPLRRELEQRAQVCQARYDLAHKRWEEQASSTRFNRAVQGLDAQRDRYCRLHAERQERLHKLGDHLRERTLRRFLESFQIAQADIDGIGPARAATLQSYGIETAADIEPKAIKAVPGFGQVYTERLLAWRRSVEAGFRFNPRRGLDRADIEAIDREIEAERVALERTLREGPAQLAQLRAQMMRARDELWPELEAAARELAQANADLRALGG
jgi:DNA-binding helix-hairpin-helix protein with protein kinase domain